jgi:hypothetical protein
LKSVHLDAAPFVILRIVTQIRFRVTRDIRCRFANGRKSCSSWRFRIVTGAFVADNNAKLVPYLGHRVTLTGQVSGGMGTILMMEATGLRIVGK